MPVVVGEKERKRERLTIIIYTATSFPACLIGLGKKSCVTNTCREVEVTDVAAYELTINWLESSSSNIRPTTIDSTFDLTH